MSIKCDICGAYVLQENSLTYCSACVPEKTVEVQLKSIILQWMEHQQAWGRPVVGDLAAQGLAAFLVQRGNL